MSLTIGTGPFARPRLGQLNFEPDAPEHILYFEDSPRRVRVAFNGETIADSRRVKLLHETAYQPVYYFPEAHLRWDYLQRTEHTSHCPFKGEAAYWSIVAGDRTSENALWAYPEPLPAAHWLGGYYAFYWDRVDAWFEEEEQVFVHPRDPYHRFDVLDSSRQVKITLDGELVAETRRPRLLFETGLPTRYYIPAEDVRADLLEPSDRHTRCPYKGLASYHHVRTPARLHRDIAWYYPEPLPAATRIAGLIAFYNERVDLEVDGERQERPRTRLG
ncbi:MAG: DUF427 domain-containing protein [Gemmatimonadetes bacterium]|nr:DUF427 domain-containing protein [Gemmatimonadota bacterium]